MEEKKIYFKQDLKKFKNILDAENMIFENNEIKQIYTDCKNMTQLEYRLFECQNEEYEYIDLSNMNLTDESLNNIIQIYSVIFKNIKLLDLSNNHISDINFLNNFSNIKYVMVNNNKLKNITLNHVLELECTDNEIETINSDSIYDLDASNNKLIEYNCPVIKNLNVSNNLLEKILYQKTLINLCCSTNQISIDFKINRIEKVKNNYYVEFFEN
jgi:hypothetical protein